MGILNLHNRKNTFIKISFVLSVFFIQQTKAQGSWTPISTLAPDSCGGVMILLSDGSVIAKAYTGGADSIGSVWNKLTPDIHGSYVNGTWSTIATMHDSRLYFGSQVLKDGRVFVGGGEYGTGGSKAEVYNPQTNIWTPAPNNGLYMGDANSEILPNGKVMIGLLTSGYQATQVYNPLTNTWSTGAPCVGGHDESSWVKLADQSILMVDVASTNSERYIPSLNQWVADATVPVQLYDSWGSETGPATLLPDGRAFFIGGTNHTAYYTPSGNNTPGTWAAGPDIPNNQGAVDAADDMMVNGKILLAVGPGPVSSSHIYDPPTNFYEFDYLSNTFTHIVAPNGADSIYKPSYYTNMLQLPNGQVLFGNQSTTQYYVYTPSGSPLVAGKPTIDSIIQDSCNLYMITGKLFNGISEGAAYGDDFQMASNYPIIRLTQGTNVYYARTFNWNRTDVQTANLPDTAMFTLPSNLASGTYQLVLTANGIASNPVSFTTCTSLAISNNIDQSTHLTIYPNPANAEVTVSFDVKMKGNYSIKIIDMLGRIISDKNNEASEGSNSTTISLTNIAKGMYMLVFDKGDTHIKSKLIEN